MKQKTVFIYENILLAERITGICLLYFYTQGCDEVNIKEINLGEESKRMCFCYKQREKLRLCKC